MDKRKIIKMFKDLKVKYEALINDATALEATYKATPTDEVLAQITAKLDSADEVKAQIANEEKRLEVEASTLARFNSLELPKKSKTQEPKDFHDIKVESVIDQDPKSGFKNLGEFAYHVFGANPNVGRGIDSRLVHIQEKAAATGLKAGTGADGGYTVPSFMSNELAGTILGAADSLLSMTRQFQVEGESMTIPGVDETSRVTGSRFGGVQGYWVAEAAQVTSSKPKFRQIKVEPQEVAVLTYVTEKLMRQSAQSLEQVISEAATDEINWLVGNAIINGSGVGQPLGIVTGTGKVSQAKEGSQTAATINAANIDKMLSRFPARSRSSAIWFINQDCLPSIEGLETANGASLFRGPSGLASAPLGTLKGIPVMPLEYCATLGTEGDIILADMKSYITGVQGGINTAMSMHLRFDYLENAFRWCFAVDGQSIISTALTPANGTNTIAPFVTLAVRA